MNLDRQTLELIRRLLIQLINALDDALGNPRTIPSSHERRVLERKARGS